MLQRLAAAPNSSLALALHYLQQPARVVECVDAHLASTQCWQSDGLGIAGTPERCLGRASLPAAHLRSACTSMLGPTLNGSATATTSPRSMCGAAKTIASLIRYGLTTAVDHLLGAPHMVEPAICVEVTSVPRLEHHLAFQRRDERWDQTTRPILVRVRVRVRRLFLVAVEQQALFAHRLSQAAAACRSAAGCTAAYTRSLRKWARSPPWGRTAWPAAAHRRATGLPQRSVRGAARVHRVVAESARQQTRAPCATWLVPRSTTWWARPCPSLQRRRPRHRSEARSAGGRQRSEAPSDCTQYRPRGETAESSAPRRLQSALATRRSRGRRRGDEGGVVASHRKRRRPKRAAAPFFWWLHLEGTFWSRSAPGRKGDERDTCKCRGFRRDSHAARCDQARAPARLELSGRAPGRPRGVQRHGAVPRQGGDQTHGAADAWLKQQTDPRPGRDAPWQEVEGVNLRKQLTLAPAQERAPALLVEQL
eukprot:scaffold50378_cov70-Phaeocystis_antarctica.AAC.3